jgi:hypothetical protein
LILQIALKDIAKIYTQTSSAKSDKKIQINTNLVLFFFSSFVPYIQLKHNKFFIKIVYSNFKLINEFFFHLLLESNNNNKVFNIFSNSNLNLKNEVQSCNLRLNTNFVFDFKNIFDFDFKYIPIQIYLNIFLFKTCLNLKNLPYFWCNK